MKDDKDSVDIWHSIRFFPCQNEPVAEISADSNEKCKLFTVTWPANIGYYKGLLRVSGNSD